MNSVCRTACCSSLRKQSQTTASNRLLPTNLPQRIFSKQTLQPYVQCDNYNLKSHRRCNMSRMNLSGYVEHASTFSRMFTIARRLVVRLG